MAAFTYHGRTALITGASSGIGEAFARALGARGMRLFLTALPAHDRELRALADELAAGGVVTAVHVIDLSERGAAQQVQIAADALGFEPDLLVNNAGIGGSRAVADSTLESQLEMVRVNVESLVGLTAAYLPRMVARGDGAVINVASTAAFQPLPYSAAYAASKAFVVRFTEAVWAETRQAGVRVVTICPGPVVTRFHHRFVKDDRTPETWKFLGSFSGIMHRVGGGPLTAAMVAERALDGLERDRPVTVRRAPGAHLIYLPGLLISRALPRRVRLRVVERLFRPQAR
jgi:short-subunit dehydrogenase